MVRRFFAGSGRLFFGSWGGALAGIQFLLGIWLVAGAGLVPWRPGFWQVFLPAFLAVELAGWRLREGMRGSIPAGS